MAVNSKKSCCLRVGPRCDKHCKNICTSCGHLIPWVDEMKYLGLFIVQSRTFKCSLDHAKRSVYRVVNGIFGRIGRMASEEVILELIKTKCLPILLYGLEVCPLSKTNFRSLDFPINRFFITLFNTSDMQIVTECQSAFNFRLPSTIIPDRCETFRAKYDSCNNSLVKPNLPCPRCNIFCFCGLNGLFGVYFVSCIRLIVLRVGSILVFVVCCFCLFFSITR